jgi:tetratricopeptide (TPR) repeat protein
MTAALEEELRNALALHQSGCLDGAEGRYGAVLRGDPSNPDAWHLLGRIAFDRREWKVAAARVLQAIRLSPRTPAFHTTLGEIFAAQGRIREASMCYREALRLEPRFLPALVNLGNALQAEGRFLDASVAYWKAVQIKPGCAEAFCNLGNALRSQGLFTEAVECYHEALRLAPGSPEAAVNLAAAHLSRHEYAEAEQWARRALEWRPHLVEALSNLSLALLNQQQYAEAEAAARDALDRAGSPACPPPAHLFANLGSVLLHQKRFAEAETAYRRALQGNPESFEAANNLGVAMRGLDRLEDSAALLLDVLRRNPRYTEAWTNLGTVRQAQNRHEEALACFDQGLQQNPAHAKSHFCRSLSLLAQGRFREGFAEYEWRWKVPGVAPHGHKKPSWDGSPLEGRRILLFAEQGLGDTIQFARFVPLVAARGGTVIVECQRGAVPLILSIPGVSQVVAAGSTLPEFDVQAPLMSLPGILELSLETLPHTTPYLTPHAAWIDSVRRNLGPASSLRVGIAWSGNPQHPSDRLRSVPLSRLAPLRAVRGVEWYSLHVGEAAQATVRQSGGWVRETLSETGGLPELAALLWCLDLVVTVDSMPAHLAGALHRPVWMLLSWAPDWRWQPEAASSPWYPSMRLFRPAAPGDWESVLEQVAGALAANSIQERINRDDMR